MTDIHNGADGCIACNRRLCRFLNATPNRRRPQEIRLSRGQRLESSEDICLRFWTIVQGTAAICKSFEDGRRQIIGLESEGDTVCGLMSTHEDTVWLEAMDECLICELDLNDRKHELANDAEFISAVFGVTHQRLETVSRHVATLGRLDSTERVILFLGEMARRNERRAGNNAHVELPMSREDIADYLGLNAETVSRVMSRIKKSGLINFLSPTEYTVPDFAAIERRLPVPVPAMNHNPLSEMIARNTPMRENSA